MTPIQELQSKLAFAGLPDDLEVVRANGHRPAEVPADWEWYGTSRIDHSIVVGSKASVIECLYSPQVHVTCDGTRRIVEVRT